MTKTLKRLYRKKFLQQLVGGEEEVSLLDFWKSYNLKNVIDNISDAWCDVKNQTLKKAWNKLWPSSDPKAAESNEIDDVTNQIVQSEAAASLVLDRNEINEWLESDSTQVGYQLFTDDEIVEIMNEENIESETDVDYDGSEMLDVVPKRDVRNEASEATNNIEKFLDWYVRQDEADSIDSMILRRLRNFALEKSQKQKKQTKITEFMETDEN